MPRPSSWRDALGHELSAAQLMAEYAKLRAAKAVDLVDWVRSRTLDRLKQEYQAWSTLPVQDWQTIAEQLASEAATEVQRRDPRLR